MEKIIEYVKKGADLLDQGLIGKNRVSRNIAFGRRLLKALREEDLGEDANQLLDELIVLADKAQKFVGDEVQPAS